MCSAFTQGENANPMTYVDYRLRHDEPSQGLDYIRYLQSGLARSRTLGPDISAAMTSFLAYQAAEHGATPSAAALVYGGLAAAGAAFYDACSTPANAEKYPGRRSLCEQGCFRRLATGFASKAWEEIRLHQDILDRRTGRRLRQPSPSFSHF